MTSNMGHLLWSGIVPTDRAGTVVRQLMSDAMFSGWGVRTLSTEDRGFNPIGYHARHGVAARQLADRAGPGPVRLPGGGEPDRDSPRSRRPRTPATGCRRRSRGIPGRCRRFPVPYPTACSPQAWATAAPLLFLRAMLGLEADDGFLTVDPSLPQEIGRIAIKGIHAFGARWTIEAEGTSGSVTPAVVCPLGSRSPASVVDDLLEGSPARFVRWDSADGRPGNRGRSDRRRFDPVAVQHRPGELLVTDGGVARADAEVGGREHHGHRGLAEVVVDTGSLGSSAGGLQ